VDLADRAMWLDHGKEVMIGRPREVVDAYQAAVDADLP